MNYSEKIKRKITSIITLSAYLFLLGFSLFHFHSTSITANDYIASDGYPESQESTFYDHSICNCVLLKFSNSSHLKFDDSEQYYYADSGSDHIVEHPHHNLIHEHLSLTNGLRAPPQST